jgi:Fur family ferric uptake transcriptional regulator
MERKTAQGDAIRAVIERAARPLTAQEVLELARAVVPRVGIATVYRNLKALLEDGWLKLVELPGDPSSRYERSHHGHHHHFQCHDCNRVFDIHGCPRGLDQITPAGFTVHSHELLLYGRCADCNGPDAQATKAATP